MHAPPKVIKLSGRRVNLEITRSNLNREIMGMHLGWYNHISLNADMAPDQIKAIAVHEILHDLDLLVGVGLSEEQNTALASVLFAAIRDNPKLMLWLMEK